MKKILVNFFVFILILSFVFQSSSASAISGVVVSDPESPIVSDSKNHLGPEVSVTDEMTEMLQEPLPPEHYSPEHRYDTEDPYADMLLDPDLPEEIRAQLMERNEPVEKPEYVPPTPEQIAQTKEHVESFSCATVTDVSQIECEALVALYNSTNGGGWTRKENWLISNSVGTWEGVGVNETGVYLLGLTENNLSGIIPPELGELSNLQYLTFWGNPISGSLPHEMGNLVNLVSLDLAWAYYLSGPIPLSFTNLTKLESFEWYSTDLCEPQSSGFQSWKSTVNYWAGSPFICIDTLCETVEDVPQVECEALVALFLNTNYSNYGYWVGEGNWLTGWLVGNWYGVTVNDGHVTSVDLSDNLHWGYGEIPPTISNLTHLTSLDLSSNDLYSSIPTEFRNLTELRFLDLSGNYFINFNTDWLSYLTNLQFLNLSSVHQNSFPQELVNLTNLVSINLADSNIPDNIPPEIGNLGNLQSLDLSSNQLIGSVPYEIGNLANLEFLDLSSNQLSGTLPDEMGNLSLLQHLDLSDNMFSGSIPLTFTNLTTLGYFNFFKTGICEPITTSFLIWKNAVASWLGSGIGCEDPEFSCLSVTDIPLLECEALVALYNYTSGSGWWDSTGWLKGTIASNWHMVSTSDGHVSDLLLPNNQLTGSIPSQLGDLTYLQYLDLGNVAIEEGIFNRITGSIPVELGHLSYLLELRLDDNELTGSIPPELGNLGSLERLNLNGNWLSGPIPPELGSLTNLRYLGLYNNWLSESLPAELGNLSNLTQLDLYGNGISGSIPLSFVNLTKLRMFNFYETGLCEPTTPEFLDWKETVMYWSGTGIICEIDDTPSWLLMYYMAGDNSLDGEIKSEVNEIIANSQSNVDIAIFLDSTSLGTSYQFIHQGIPDEIFDKGNLNSGDGPTLSEFVQWAKARSIAPHYALIIADHGHALAGAAWDDRAGKDYISVDDELRLALLASGPVEVLYSHACLLANLEFMWELRGLTDFYVGNESVSFTTSNDYILAISHETTAENLAISMANSYYSHWKNSSTASTVSVVNMAYIDEMFLATNALALAIHEASLAVKIDLWNLLDYTVLQRFHERERHEDDPEVIDNYDRLADLFHFASLANYFGDVSPAAQTLLDVENDFVIYNRAWTNNTWNHNNARGVSIALPLNPTSFYDGEWLDFATGADWSFAAPTVQSSIQEDGYNWGPMISELIEVNNPEGENDPLPPDPLPLLVNYDIFLPVLIR